MAPQYPEQSERFENEGLLRMSITGLAEKMKKSQVERFDNFEQILINQMFSAYMPTMIQKDSKDHQIGNNS